MKQHPLMGRIALVRSDREGIPVALRASVGTIISVEQSRKALYLELELDHRSTAGAFEARDLLVLRLPGDILTRKRAVGKALPEAGARELDRVRALLRLGQERLAMAAVLRHKNLRTFCLTDGREWMRAFEQKQKKPHKRKL